MRKLFFFLFVLLLTSTGYAQNKITGKVLDETGEPVIGALIKVKGTSNGAKSDFNGAYSLSAPPNSILVISAMEFEQQEINIGSRTTINITMKEKVMKEVVVTANNIEKSEKQLGYKVSTVTAEDLTKARESNPIKSLAGKVAGLDVTSSSGGLGGSTRVVIRGTSSIGGNNQPLYVVDGIPIDNSTVASSGSFTAPDYGNRGADINADDIASMTVLKGPAAAVLYGSRASNGAIIITTKSGSRNSKPVVAFSSSARFDNPLVLPTYQNKYGQGGYGKYFWRNRSNWGPEMDGREYIEYDGDTASLVAQPNNTKDFFETGTTYINNLSVSGGTKMSSYRIGFTDTRQKGIVPNTKLDKQVVSAKLKTDLSKKVSSTLSVNYSKTTNDGRPTQGFNSGDVLVNNVYFFPRNLPLDSLKTYKDTLGRQNVFLDKQQNPYWSIHENMYRSQVDRFIGSGALSYKPIDWLNLTWRIGIDTYTDYRKQIYKPTSTDLPLGGFWNHTIFNRQINNDIFATVTKKLGNDLTLTAIVGHNVFEKFSRDVFVEGKELSDPTLFNIANAKIKIPEEDGYKWRVQGAYFDFGFDFKNYLFLNLTGRNDWNSTLPKENRSFFYPAASMSFVFSEAFDLSSDVFSMGKIRANIAQVGNGTSPYLLRFRAFPQTSIFQLFGVYNTYPWGPNRIVGYRATEIIPAQNLKPERTTSWEVGTDLQFFKNRLSLDVTYYSSLIKDQILNLSIPWSTGFGFITDNIGDVRNRGIEIGLSGAITTGEQGSLGWNAGVNFSKNNNVLVKLGENYKSANVPGTATSPSLRADVGQPIGTIVGVGWERAPDGQYLINPTNGLRIPKKDTVVGNTTADFNLGLTNTFTFRGFSLNFLIHWKQGGDIHSRTISELRSGGHAEETAQRDQAYIISGVIKQGEGKTATYVPNDIPVTAAAFWGDVSDEEKVFDATFVKLREVSFGYSFNKKMLGKLPFSSVYLGVEGRNLALLYTRVPHIDPEVSFYGASNAQGIEAYNLPNTRSFGFSLKATF